MPRLVKSKEVIHRDIVEDSAEQFSALASIPKDHPLIKNMPLQVYMYMLCFSDCELRGRDVYSTFKVSELIDLLLDTEAEIRTALIEMEQKQMLEVRGDDIWMGRGVFDEKTGNVIVDPCMPETVEPIDSKAITENYDFSFVDKEFMELNKLLKVIPEEKRPPYVKAFNAAYKTAKEIDKGNKLFMTPTIYGDLFKAMYYVSQQYPYRELTGKEYGQLKSLIKGYKPMVLVKMLLLYFLNFEKYWSKSDAPGIGILLTVRDSIYHDIVGVKKSNSRRSRKKRNRSKDSF